MSAIYRSELEAAGLVESRTWDTESAVAGLHRALCKMDNANRGAFLEYAQKCGGLLGLLKRYAELEELNTLD